MSSDADEDSVDRIVQAWAKSDPDLDPRPLEVVGRLLLCARYCEREIVAGLAPLGLSFGDFDVINTLRRRGGEPGTNPTDLARSSLITSGAMTTRLDRLERRGLVERRADPADRRAVRVRLTADGKRLAELALDAVLGADERFLAPLDERDRDAVAATLKRLLLPYERDGPS
jgi:DNA-binding MarR family transcriptional regulator